MENNLLLPEDLQTGGLLHVVIVEFLFSAYKNLQKSLAKRYFSKFWNVAFQFVWCFGFWLSVKYVNWLLGHFYTILLWNEILHFQSDCVYTRESEFGKQNLTCTLTWKTLHVDDLVDVSTLDDDSEPCDCSDSKVSAGEERNWGEVGNER